MGVEAHSRPFHGFCQEVVQRVKDVTGLRVVAGCELLVLALVAGAAVARGDHGGNEDALVVVPVGIVPFGFMALDATDALARVCTAGPVTDNPW